MRLGVRQLVMDCSWLWPVAVRIELSESDRQTDRHVEFSLLLFELRLLVVSNDQCLSCP